MKSCIRAVLSICSISLCMPWGSVPLAAQHINVRASNEVRVQVDPDQEVTVPVRVDLTEAGSLTLASLQSRVTWSDHLTFDSIRVVPALGLELTSNLASVASRELTFNVYGSQALAASGDVVNLYFTAGSNESGGSINIETQIAGSETGESILDFVSSRGLGVCVGFEGLWGDVTGDEAVNVVDAQQIARYSVGLSVVDTASTQDRGDVTADAAVNVIDAQQIARYTVGLTASARTGQSLSQLAAVSSLSLVLPQSRADTVGTWFQADATLSDATGDPLTGCSSITWSSTDETVVEVDARGLIQFVGAGTATVTATAGSASASTEFSPTAGNAGPAAKLAFVTQPSATTEAGVAFAQQPVIEILDANDNRVTSSTASVALALTSGTGTLSGTATVTAVDGVATFSGLSLDVAGTGKVLTATSDGLTSAASSAFAITAAAGDATASSIAASPSTDVVADGATASTLTLTVYDALSNPVLGASVFFATTGGTLSDGPWTTDASGQATATLVSSAPGTETVTGYLGTDATGESVGTADVEFVAEVASVSVSKPSFHLYTGRSLQWSADPQDAGGSSIIGLSGSWTSQDEAVATVSSSGEVTGVGPGSTTIVATYQGVTGSLGVTVATSDCNLVAGNLLADNCGFDTAEFASGSIPGLTPWSVLRADRDMSEVRCNGSSNSGFCHFVARRTWDGSYSGPADPSRLIRQFTTETGVTYDLSFHLALSRVIQNYDPHGFQVFVNGANLLTLKDDGDGLGSQLESFAPREYSLSFTAASTTTTIEIRYWTASGIWMLDDFVIVPSP